MASAGITCPPVPPPAMMMRMNSYRCWWLLRMRAKPRLFPRRYSFCDLSVQFGSEAYPRRQAVSDASVERSREVRLSSPSRHIQVRTSDGQKLVPIPKIRNRKSAPKVLVESRRKLTLQDGWRWEHCKLISKNHGGEKPDELSGFVPESGFH